MDAWTIFRYCVNRSCTFNLVWTTMYSSVPEKKRCPGCGSKTRILRVPIQLQRVDDELEYRLTELDV